MTKKETCLNNSTFAYYSGLNGVELKNIEYGIDDYIYCVSNAWSGSPAYHKLKVKYDDEKTYITCRGIKILLSDCIRC